MGLIRTSNCVKGFTLIEIVVVTVILAILGGFTYSFINNATKTYVTGARQSVLFEKASNVMGRLTQELKDSNTVLSGTTWIYFYKTNTSGQQDTNYDIMYFLAGNNLYRYSGGRNRLMTDNVSDFSVSGSALSCNATNPDCIIAINLELQDSTVTMGEESPKPLTIFINTSVAPKNFASGVGGRSYNGYYYDIVEQ